MNVPLALIGGVFGLFMMREYLSVPAAIGFIALFGIAVQNGVVLVSYINQLRQQGIETKQAIVTGALQRLRPDLMTAMTTVLGLTPLLLSKGIGSEVQRPLASVVVFGLTIGSVGSNERMIKKMGVGKKMIKNSDLVIGVGSCPCHHPGSLPNTQTIKVKLIFLKPKGLLLGAQLIGPDSVGEMVNTISLAIQQGVIADELSVLQIATHPLLTPAPTVYPLIIAAQSALSKIRGQK